MQIQTKPQSINHKLIKNAFSYSNYLELLNELFIQGKTTGETQNEAMLNYAKMNLQRMNRLNKTAKLSEEILSSINSVERDQTWLLITEGWCGDAAQNLPVINKIAEASSKIELKIILRDENLDVMDQFLTNGGRSIPKLIILDTKTLDVLGTWGPRPDIAQKMVLDFKKNPDGDYQEFQKQLQLWYAKDKTSSQQIEFTKLIQLWDKNGNNS
jgi:hypothetical protein